MFFKKRVEQKENEMFEMIKTLLPTNATVVSFDYNEKVFGNIVLKLEIGKDTHTFITDRGEILPAAEEICDLFNKCLAASLYVGIRLFKIAGIPRVCDLTTVIRMIE